MLNWVLNPFFVQVIFRTIFSGILTTKNTEVSIPSSIRSSSEPDDLGAELELYLGLNPFINQVIFRTFIPHPFIIPPPVSQSLHQSGHLPNARCRRRRVGSNTRLNPFINQVIFRTPITLSGGLWPQKSQSLHQSGHLPNNMAVKEHSKYRRLNPFINQVIFRTTPRKPYLIHDIESQSLHQSGHLPNDGTNPSIRAY